ncbi:tannase/feruloyl esterase family alpha/beta hydrolase [Blastococcus sp. SYSU D00922]
MTATASAALVAPAASAAPPPRQPAPADPVMACGDLTQLALPGTTVTAAAADAGDATTPASCRVTLSVADPEDSGVVTVWVYLPEDTWNGRFQGVGGGGFSGGSTDRLLAPLRNGYAAAATDAGHVGSAGTFGLYPDGTPNWPAREDFGHEGVHDMTVTAKAVVQAYYGQAPAYSYWNGCSTGGRQGLMEAQRYPDDYDGVLAGAPVINFPEMQTGQIWGQIVMLQEDNPIPACKFETALAAAIQACDTVGDGVVDGVIGDPFACDFDLTRLIGTPTPCGAITEDDVAVMQRIHEGPRGTDGRFLWYGLPYGAPYAGLHDVKLDGSGQLVGNPFVYDLWWIQYFLADDPAFDWRTIDYADFEGLFDLAVERYGDMMGASDPDLSAFRASGGKLLMWHGLADFGVTVKGTVDYYERLLDELGPGHTQQFARLFLAPGVGHCGGGAGAQLTDPFAALVQWVEQGKAPKTLDARTTAGATRPVCAYPFVARWTGRGDSADGSTYRCVPATRLELREA